MDDDPRNFQGRGIIAVLHLLSQTVREVMAIVVILVGFVSVRLLLFRCMPASRHSDSTPDIRCVFLCVHDYRALRTVCTVPGSTADNSRCSQQPRGRLWWKREELYVVWLRGYTRGNVSLVCTFNLSRVPLLRLLIFLSAAE